MNVSPSPAGSLSFDRFEKFAFKKNGSEIFVFFSSKFPSFQISKFPDFRFQNFQISDFKISRFRKISKFSDFEISKSVDTFVCFLPVYTPGGAPSPCRAGSSIQLIFYQRIVFRGAEILALVRTIVEWTWREPHFAPQEATSCGFYELESIENLSILCDSTMDLHEIFQLLATLSPSSGRLWEC